ncbi:MAG: Cna B-type domain-containing protein, partial [Oscillospiraceae bacterium]|nr:Cna B-type domain-containing protein [Oscillospiraceae bacterium]
MSQSLTDMVIRGQSIEFSAESVTEDAITLKYARLKDNAIVDYVLTDDDGIPALYTTDYETADGETYSIQWYYGNTTLFGTDEKIDNGPLTAFDSTSSVTRHAVANVYGILSTADTSTPGATDFDLSKSKEATQLELQEDGTLTSDVTISLPSASYTGDLDVVFVLDGSTSTDEKELAAQAAALLESLLEYENLDVKAGVIIFGGSEPILYNSTLVTLDATTCAALTAELTDTDYNNKEEGRKGYGRSGSNLQAGVEAARALLNGDTSVDSADKYMIILSDGAARMWYDSDSGEAVSQTYVPDSRIFWNSNEDWIRRYDSTSSIFEPLSFAAIWTAGQNGAVIDAYAMTESQYKAASVGDSGIADWDTVTEDPDYYTTYEAATYYAATSIVAAAEESNVIFVSYPYNLGTTYGDYIDSFQAWLENVVTRYDSSAASAETIFAEVEDQLIQLVDAGSAVVDEIGDTDDYAFDFINDISRLTLTVDGEALAVTLIDEYSYGFGSATGSSDGTTYPFVLTYYPEGTTYGGTAYNECYVLAINVPITKNEQVKLTYGVVLTNPQTETGVYGTYDQYGDNNDGGESYGLYTNNVARLYPVDSNGNSLPPEDFQKPTVSYAVINVTKTWDDANDQDGKRPDSVIVRLLADGVEVASAEITEADGWTYRFVLPAEDGVTYTVTEDAVTGYTTTYDGYDITNSYTPGQVSVTVTKAWSDGNDQDGIRPASVTVTLVKNGVATAETVTLSAANSWTASFTGLDEYTDGVLNTYTVQETAAEGYTSTVTGDMATGYVITNSHTPTVTPTPSPTPTDPGATETPEPTDPGTTET